MTSRPVDPISTAGAGGIPDELAQIRHQVQTLSSTLLAARRPSELMDTVAEIEALKSTLDAFELDVVGELEATHAVKPVGWASTQDFVTAMAGGHRGSGSAVIRLAKEVGTPLMAPVGEALGHGWLSTAKAHVILRAIEHLPGDPEVRERGVAFMLSEAKGLDASELRRVGRKLISVLDPDGEARREERDLAREERGAHLDRNLAIKDDGAGGCWINGRCSSEDGATLRTTLMPLATPVPSNGPVCDPQSCDLPGCGHDGRDPRDHGARMIDALVQLCDNAAKAGLLPECHGVTPRVSVTINLEDLKQLTGFGTTETGEDLSAATVRRLACDADVIPVVLGTRGEVLDVGHHQRLATAAIWKGLVARDQHCRFPRCTRPPVMCHAHHLIHWCDGGPTSLENLILLCGHHHRLIHAGPWTIRKTTPGELVFDPPPGTRRMRTPGREPPDDFRDV